MASDNWKREAWVQFATSPAAGDYDDGSPTARSSTSVARYADYMLALVEQREREGRFGVEEVPPPAGYSLKGWANPNAVKRYEETIKHAEAGAERLKAELAEVEKTHHEMLDAKERRARKAESLLKEALKALRAWKIAWEAPVASAAHARLAANAATEEVQARARQGGFSDGE